MPNESLVEILATIPDPRGRCGKIHPLTAVLSLTVVATLAGMKTLEAIAQFGRDHGLGLAHALGFRRAKTPTKSMFSKLFRRLDVSLVEAALHRWVQARLRETDDRIAIDGKTLRGSAAGEVPGVHLLAAYAPHAAAVIGQLRVDAKTNEHKAALTLLGILPMQGKIVSGDAMFTHRDFCEKIRTQGGDYLLPVKDNQTTLQAEIAAVFDDTAFSPLPTAASGSRASNGQQRGQGARSVGAALDRDDHATERLCGLAERRPSIQAGARADAEGEDGSRGGPWHHQPLARASRCGAVAGVGARTLVDRE